jgi:hypothetical protein
MSQQEGMYYEASYDGVAPSRFSGKMLKVGAAFFAGACVGLVAVSVTSQNSITDTNTSLFGQPTLQRSPMVRTGHGALASLPGPSPWKELAIAAMQDVSGACDRDVSSKAYPHMRAAMANLDPQTKSKLQRLNVIVNAKAKAKKSASVAFEDLPGAIAPLGFWDPFALSADVEDDGKLLFFREAEVKHGRVCMVASLGFVVGERVHPLFGGDVDVPSLYAPQQVQLDRFWPIAFLVMGGIEFFSFGRDDGGGFLAPGLAPGDLGFDPLGLTPKTEEQLVTLQNKEILNGRLAMISMLGMILEELVTQEKLHGLPF